MFVSEAKVAATCETGHLLPLRPPGLLAAVDQAAPAQMLGPIQMLMRHLVAVKLHDHYHRYLDPLPGRRDAVTARDEEDVRAVLTQPELVQSRLARTVGLVITRALRAMTGASSSGSIRLPPRSARHSSCTAESRMLAPFEIPHALVLPRSAPDQGGDR
jgi:hypothetical protein